MGGQSRYKSPAGGVVVGLWGPQRLELWAVKYGYQPRTRPANPKDNKGSRRLNHRHDTASPEVHLASYRRGTCPDGSDPRVETACTREVLP
jgi:hypothetical protein